MRWRHARGSKGMAKTSTSGRTPTTGSPYHLITADASRCGVRWTCDIGGLIVAAVKGSRRTDQAVDLGDEAASPPPESPEGAEGSGGRNNFVRVTVNLTPAAYKNLQEVSTSHGLGKTDVINRALQVYALVERLLDDGNGRLTIVNSQGEQERIYIL